MFIESRKLLSLLAVCRGTMERGVVSRDYSPPRCLIEGSCLNLGTVLEALNAKDAAI